jgi:hypothetical protein
VSSQHQNNTVIQNYAIEITNLPQNIAPWALTKNHQLTFGLNSNSLQAPMKQAFAEYLAIILHNPG